MNAGSPQIELPPARRMTAAGVVPWIVLLVSASVLIVLLFKLLQDIPYSLQMQASQLVDSSGFGNVQVLANGRDLHLSGNINQGESLDPLLDKLTGIEGVRTIKDRVAVVDPQAAATENAQVFEKKLRAIDTRSVAFHAGSVFFTPDSEPALQAIHDLMKDYPTLRIRIEGHTDDTGPDSVNLRMSNDRAAAVATYLSDRGIAPERMIVKGYGSTQPIDSNDTESGRSRNRRIELSHVY